MVKSVGIGAACAIFSFSLGYSLHTHSSTRVLASSGMESLYSNHQAHLLPDIQLYPSEWRYRGLASNRWAMQNWTQGKVTLLQALGIHKGTISYPPLEATMPAQVSQSQQQTQTGGGTGGASGGGSGLPKGGTEAQNAQLGQQMAAAQPYNWTGAQWVALNNIVMAESGWNDTIANPSSGAYGIPQALPGSKMASAGADWQTDPRTQIAWMLQYIQQRYGTPVRAWQFHLANGWY